MKVKENRVGKMFCFIGTHKGFYHKSAFVIVNFFIKGFCKTMVSVFFLCAKSNYCFDKNSELFLLISGMPRPILHAWRSTRIIHSSII